MEPPADPIADALDALDVHLAPLLQARDALVAAAAHAEQLQQANALLRVKLAAAAAYRNPDRLREFWRGRDLAASAARARALIDRPRRRPAGDRAPVLDASEALPAAAIPLPRSPEEDHAPTRRGPSDLPRGRR